jgi:hypothetical protein
MYINIIITIQANKILPKASLGSLNFFTTKVLRRSRRYHYHRENVFKLEALLLTALLLCALFCRGKLNIDHDSNHSLHVDLSGNNLFRIQSYFASLIIGTRLRKDL